MYKKISFYDIEVTGSRPSHTSSDKEGNETDFIIDG